MFSRIIFILTLLSCLGTISSQLAQDEEFQARSKRQSPVDFLDNILHQARNGGNFISTLGGIVGGMTRGGSSAEESSLSTNPLSILTHGATTLLSPLISAGVAAGLDTRRIIHEGSKTGTDVLQNATGAVNDGSRTVENVLGSAIDGIRNFTELGGNLFRSLIPKPAADDESSLGPLDRMLAPSRSRRDVAESNPIATALVEPLLSTALDVRELLEDGARTGVEAFQNAASSAAESVNRAVEPSFGKVRNFTDSAKDTFKITFNEANENASSNIFDKLLPNTSTRSAPEPQPPTAIFEPLLSADIKGGSDARHLLEEGVNEGTKSVNSAIESSTGEIKNFYEMGWHFGSSLYPSDKLFPQLRTKRAAPDSNPLTALFAPLISRRASDVRRQFDQDSSSNDIQNVGDLGGNLLRNLIPNSVNSESSNNPLERLFSSLGSTRMSSQSNPLTAIFGPLISAATDARSRFQQSGFGLNTASNGSRTGGGNILRSLIPARSDSNIFNSLFSPRDSSGSSDSNPLSALNRLFSIPIQLFRGLTTGRSGGDDGNERGGLNFLRQLLFAPRSNGGMMSLRRKPAGNAIEQNTKDLEENVDIIGSPDSKNAKEIVDGRDANKIPRR